MPRPRTLVGMIQGLVRKEVEEALQSLLGGLGGTQAKAKNGRRRRKARGKWRPGGPGRPPKAVAEKMAREKKAGVAGGGQKHKRRRRRRARGSKKTAA